MDKINLQEESVKIVITDDEESMRNFIPFFIQRCLDERKINVEMGKSKADLISLVEKHNPHIIITDKDMPLKNEGIYGIIELRKKYETPIILMSGDMYGAKEKLNGLRQIYLLEKPFDLSKFEKTLCEAYPEILNMR